MDWVIVGVYVCILVYHAVDNARQRRKMWRLFDKTSAMYLDANMLVSFYVQYFDADKWQRDLRGRGNAPYDRRKILEDSFEASRQALWHEYLDQTGQDIAKDRDP